MIFILEVTVKNKKVFCGVSLGIGKNFVACPSPSQEPRVHKCGGICGVACRVHFYLAKGLCMMVRLLSIFILVKGV